MRQCGNPLTCWPRMDAAIEKGLGKAAASLSLQRYHTVSPLGHENPTSCDPIEQTLPSTSSGEAIICWKHHFEVDIFCLAILIDNT